MEKSDKKIMREILAIMRHIASSITYFPCLDGTNLVRTMCFANDHYDHEIELSFPEHLVSCCYNFCL